MKWGARVLRVKSVSREEVWASAVTINTIYTGHIMAVTINTRHINGSGNINGQSPLIWAILMAVTINTGDIIGPINGGFMAVNGRVLFFD